MPRTIWKGAITFGLVHIPVALRAASREHKLDLDWLDRRDMAPVGYKRINKRTGEAIESENIVKGYAYESGQYVLLNDEDFRQANPEATQTVDILGFVDVADVTPEYYVAPYYLEVLRRGEKGYALLRRVLKESGRAGIASVVMHSRQHLALLTVHDEWLMLNTLRFADEVLAPQDMVVVDEAAAQVGPAELDMARRLVDEMTQPWQPAQYRDTYRDDLMRRIDARIGAGQTHELAPAPHEAPGKGPGAPVIDLMAALRQSLERKGAAATASTAKKAPSRAAAASASAPASTGPAKEPALAATKGSARKTAPAAGKKSPVAPVAPVDTPAVKRRKESAR